MSYKELQSRISRVKKSLENAVSEREVNYFGMELMVLEEMMEKTISKGRR